VSHLLGVGGAKSIGFGASRVRSLPDAVAKVLATHFEFAVNGSVVDKASHSNGHAEYANGHANGHSNGIVLTNGHTNGVSHQPLAEEEKPEMVAMQQLSLQTSQGDLSATDGNATGLFDICPECGGGSLAYEEGCRKCYSCGYSEC